MSLGNVTYGQLNNEIANYIYNNCCNVKNATYNNLPNEVKETWGGLKNGYGKKDYINYINVNIVANTGIVNRSSEVTSASSIINDMLEYVPLNKYPTNENISMPKFLSYFNNICCFCVKNIGYISSSFNYNNYLVYDKTRNFDDVTTTFDNKIDDLVYASSANDVINVLKNKLSNILRCKPCKYVITSN